MNKIRSNIRRVREVFASTSKVLIFSRYILQYGLKVLLKEFFNLQICIINVILILVLTKLEIEGQQFLCSLKNVYIYKFLFPNCCHINVNNIVVSVQLRCLEGDIVRGVKKRVSNLGPPIEAGESVERVTRINREVGRGRAGIPVLSLPGESLDDRYS